MVCILMSTYNGEKYLEEQLESLIRQKGAEIKILIRDDGSIDGTRLILKRWQEDYPVLIELLLEENIGFAMSFTHLVQIAVERYHDADFYAFCDQDDVWLPNKLAVAVGKLPKEHSDIPITYCSNTTLVDSNLKFISKHWKSDEVCLTKERALIQSFATGCTMVFNRRAAEIYVTHTPSVIKVHDFLMYQICMFLGQVIYDRHSHILYRQHGGNQIGSPNAWGRLKRRFEWRNRERTLELQNYYFLETYRDLLSVEDIYIFSQIVFYRRSLFNRVALIFNHKISYTKLEYNFFFILKIIIGRV